jgi:hypothetical protein
MQYDDQDFEDEFNEDNGEDEFDGSLDKIASLDSDLQGLK